MSEFIATYDLKKTSPDPYAKFKAIGKEANWFDFGLDSRNANVAFMPNTTLCKSCSDMREAVRSFAAVVATAATQIPNFKRERVVIIGGGEVCGFDEDEPLRY